MYVEEGDYENFKNEEINNLSKLNFEFNLSKRFVDARYNNDEYFSIQTPFLKVLKPMHVTLNKKKTIAKKYLVLETNDELDFNNQISEFMFIINKIHEVSQEKIKENSLEWFNTEFDEIGLDIKIRRPVEQQRDNEFIRLCIPKNKEIEEKIVELNKGEYVLCNIIFKGLKVSQDYIVEEWEVTDLIRQEDYDKEIKEKENENEITKISELVTMLEEDLKENIEKKEENYDLEMIIKSEEIQELEQTEQIEETEKMEEIQELEQKDEDMNKYFEKEINIKENEMMTLQDISVVEVENGECKEPERIITEKKKKLKEKKVEKLKNKKVDIIKKNRKIVYF